jgi:lauroyl/myristoyl acyltransferase
MDTRKIISQGWPVRLALRVGKYLPLWGAGLAARLGAWFIMLLKPDLYQHARANLRHVLPADSSEKELKQILYKLFYNTPRRYYELFHNFGRGRTRASEFNPPVYITEQTKTYVQQAVDAGRGLFVLACHTSNFDFGGIALSQFMPIPLKVLSLADPSTDMEIFNDLRSRCGVDMTPISAQALRDVMGILRDGGAATTGPDYPIGEGDEIVEFFGEQALLPARYIRIPLRTRSLVLVVAIHYEDGAYWVMSSPPIEMERTGDRKQDEAHNLRRVLSHVEDFIRQHPEEWMMFVPVWKEDNL